MASVVPSQTEPASAHSEHDEKIMKWHAPVAAMTSANAENAESDGTASESDESEYNEEAEQTISMIAGYVNPSANTDRERKHQHSEHSVSRCHHAHPKNDEIQSGGTKLKSAAQSTLSVTQAC